MHCIIRIKRKPVILLSNNAVFIVYEKLQFLINIKQLHCIGIQNFIRCLEYYIYDNIPILFDMILEFENNPNDLQILIDLLIEAIDEICKEHEDFDEAENILGFVDDLKQLLAEIKLPESFA